MKLLLLAPHPFFQNRGTPIAMSGLARVLGEAGQIFFAGTTPGTVVRSEDAGASWQPGSLGLPYGSAVVAVTGSTSVAIAAVVVEENW